MREIENRGSSKKYNMHTQTLFRHFHRWKVLDAKEVNKETQKMMR